MSATFIYPLVDLFYRLSKRKRKLFWLFVILSVINSFAEIISIGAIVPLLIAISNPTRLQNNEYLIHVWEKFSVDTPNEIVIVSTVIFLFAIFISALIKFSIIRLQSKFSHGSGHELSIFLFQAALYQPYEVHKSRNPSVVTSVVASKASNIVNGAFMPITTLISSFITIILSIFVLLMVSSYLFFITLAVISVTYILIYKRTKVRLDKLGLIINQETDKVYKAIQEGLGAIKDIKLSKTQGFYLHNFATADQKKRRSEASAYILSSDPRVVIETIGMVALILVVVLMKLKTGDLKELLPIFGVLALAAQRLLPIVNRIYASIVQLRVGHGYVLSALAMLDTPQDENDATGPGGVTLQNSIELKGVGFSFDTKKVLSGINLYISAGSTVGIIGPTGSGKSTLLDILMALLKPTEGELLVDGVEINQSNERNWKAVIAHVPQDVYLADVSIAENIALGEPIESIDLDLVRQAAENAKISEYIESQELGYMTSCGERGIKLSGGQKQRIAIARALYKNAKLVVLDEATSALDNTIEAEVMKSIYNISEDITVIIVAHTLSTLEKCDQIFELRNGALKNVQFPLESS